MTAEYELRHYFVAFIDVLGQRERLRQLRWPRTDEEWQQTLDVLRRTAGFVLTLRESFDGFFEEQAKPTGLLDDLPEPARSHARNWRRCTATHRGVSDSIIVTVPLSNENDQCNSLASTYSAMYAVAGICMMALAGGHALRGGLDVGACIEIATGEVYGAAAERAYSLESRDAHWPRVLIGDELWRYLTLAQTELPDTQPGQIAKDFAAEAKNLVTVAEDGRRMLDFLGNGVRSVTDGLPQAAIQAAFDFVATEEVRFRAEGNADLADRYGALLRYMSSRRQLWL